MTDLIANRLFDKGFPNERVNCTEPFQNKKFKKDIEQIFFKEKIIDYRCYLSKKAQIIYYIAETKNKYLAFRQVIRTSEIDIYEMPKGEL